MSALQLASSFAITVNGPPVLCQGISITACASSSLTVALSWISCMICTCSYLPCCVCELSLTAVPLVLLYSFSLLTTAITHMSVIPDVWTASIRSIPWFVEPTIPVESRPTYSEKARRHSDVVVDIKRASVYHSTPIYEQHTKALPPSPCPIPQSPLKLPKFPSTPTSPVWPPRKGSAGSFDSVAFGPIGRRTTWTSRVLNGAASLSHKYSNESMRPNWAKRGAARRGVDLPFSMPHFSLKTPPPVRPLRPLKLKSCWSQSTMSPPPVPTMPPRARVSNTATTTIPAPGPLDTSLSPTSTFYIDLERAAVVSMGPVATRPMSYGMFPEDVMDPDQPITQSRRTEWVRADSPSSSLKSR